MVCLLRIIRTRPAALGGQCRQQKVASFLNHRGSERAPITEEFHDEPYAWSETRHKSSLPEKHGEELSAPTCDIAA